MNQITGIAGIAPLTDERSFEEELADVLGRFRHDRGVGPAKGYRHGHRERQRTGTFGTGTLRGPRARIEGEDGEVTEWRSKALGRYPLPASTSGGCMRRGG